MAEIKSKQNLQIFLAGIEGRAFRIAHIATGNRDDALELVQEATIKLVQKYATRSEGEWAPLFYKILQTRILDWHRRQAVRNRFRTWFTRPKDAEQEDEEDALEQFPDDGSHEPSAQMENAQFMSRLNHELGILPHRQQQVFLLRVWEGMDIAKTALVMNCSESSVKTHYARALKRLRGQLEDLQ